MVRRGYTNLRNVRRAEALSFDMDAPAVRELAAQIHEQLAPLYHAQNLWFPRARTIARYLGAFYTGVKLANDPLPVWRLSLAEWGKVLDLSPSVVAFMNSFLGDTPLLAPRERGSTDGPTVLGQGLGLLKRTARTETMRVWFPRAGRSDRLTDESAGPHDKLMELAGPSDTELTPKGLAALGLDLTLVEQLKLRLAAGPSEAEIVNERERLSKKPSPKKRLALVDDPDQLCERFTAQFTAAAGKLEPLHVVAARPAAAVRNQLPQTIPLEQLARVGALAETFAKAQMAEAERTVGRPFANDARTALYDRAYELAYAALNQQRASGGRGPPDTPS